MTPLNIVLVKRINRFMWGKKKKSHVITLSGVYCRGKRVRMNRYQAVKRNTKRITRERKEIYFVRIASWNDNTNNCTNKKVTICTD